MEFSVESRNHKRSVTSNSTSSHSSLHRLRRLVSSFERGALNSLGCGGNASGETLDTNAIDGADANGLPFIALRLISSFIPSPFAALKDSLDFAVVFITRRWSKRFSSAPPTPCTRSVIWRSMKARASVRGRECNANVSVCAWCAGISTCWCASTFDDTETRRATCWQEQSISACVMPRGTFDDG